MEWSVSIDYGVARAPDDRLLDDVAERLAQHSGVVFVGSRSIGAMIAVSSADLASAAKLADAIIRTAMRRSGIRITSMIESHAIEWTRFEETLSQPPVPELVGATEAAALLGVSRQRFHEIRRTLDFPAPLTEVAATPLWTRAGIDEFLRGWARKPGRPPAAGAAADR